MANYRSPMDHSTQKKSIPRTLLVVGLVVCAIAAVCCFVFSKDQALQSVAAALFLIACMVTLPRLLRRKRKTRFYSPQKGKSAPRKKATRDPYRLAPQDKGKIIRFPDDRSR